MYRFYIQLSAKNSATLNGIEIKCKIKITNGTRAATTIIVTRRTN